MNETNPTPPPASSLPAAVPVRRRRLPFAWLLPVLGLAVVGYFAYWAYTQNEPNVTLRLEDASGIKAFQTPVRCRGVEVGTVTNVALSPNGNGATVSIRLNESGLPLATPDSDWWVLRPEFSLTDVSGVESLLAGPSIEYRPGEEVPRRNKSFTALSGPPSDAGMTGGLRLFITSDQRDAIEPGTSVRFRGIPIGRVVSMRLPTHGQSVVFIAEIDLPFAHLIREKSVFWHRKRAVANLNSVSLGLGGYQIDFPRLNSALDISIDVATPDNPGEEVTADSIFQMQHAPPEDFETWAPNLIPVEEPAPTPEQDEQADADPDTPADPKPDPLGDIFNFINPFD
ncbi:MlaD family protein [Algisphaera agarilytica]|uniref:Paraquat-inducible protein B n=1 Tax=Algisphaera agarilytica TaxID=1385975 RepID=A0A7X0H5R5_9BACT|nr:MlaD family protein [Algisphaera agarilytica]MBB6429791.1 paraquat-inducible protein B [Algisphaera agarilytica]